MIRTVEAIVEADGRIRLLEPIAVAAARRVLVTILEEEPRSELNESARLSEPALAEDWSRPEEDAAWSHLQLAR